MIPMFSLSSDDCVQLDSEAIFEMAGFNGGNGDLTSGSRPTGDIYAWTRRKRRRLGEFKRKISPMKHVARFFLSWFLE